MGALDPMILLLLLLLLLVGLTSAIQQESANQTTENPPQMKMWPPHYREFPVHMTDDLNKSLHDNIGIWVTSSFRHPTELVLSKCGQPLYISFQTKRLRDLLPAEDVFALQQAHNFECAPGVEGNRIDVTLQAHPNLHGRIAFSPDTHDSRINSSVKLHNVTSPIISNVSFSLEPNETNTYPMKIGPLLYNVTNDSNRQLMLSVHSNEPVHFIFSKCEFKIPNLPFVLEKPLILENSIIHFLQVLQNEDCGKWWMDGIIELRLTAGSNHTSGVLTFHVVEPQDHSNLFILLLGIIPLFLIVSLINVTIVGVCVNRCCPNEH